MGEVNIEEIIEQYPYLKQQSEYKIFTTKEDLDTMRNSEKIIVNGKEVSVEFLNRVLKNDLYFRYALKFLSGQTKYFEVSFIFRGDLCGTIGYSKTQITRGIDSLMASKKLELTEEETERFDILKNHITYDELKEKYKTSNYDIEIDDNKYSIPVMDLLSILEISEEEFTKLCNDNDIKEINNIKKEYFIYAAIQFVKQNDIHHNYLLPTNVINTCKSITSLQTIDLEAINKHTKTTDKKHKEIIIDKELEKAILKDMPEHLSNLEKAIYIYIKMCKIFTYDEEYYALNQKGEATLKHKSTKYISNINLENNKIVCFEFNLIYSKLLSDLGINFSTEYKNMVGEAYGYGHANLEFRSDKYLVRADSVTSILQGDIMQAKLNQPLRGLECLNHNKQTQKEFTDTVSKIYKLIAAQEQKQDNIRVEHIQTFDELMSEYTKCTTNIKEVDLSEKLSILIEKVNETKMVGVDSLSYVLQLRKILFNEVQRNENLKVTIVRNNEPFDKTKVAMTSAIFTLNPVNFSEHTHLNMYFYYNPNHNLIPISQEELQTKFNNKTFEYITEEDPRIPGIIEEGGPKR